MIKRNSFLYSYCLQYTRIPFEFSDLASSAERVDAMESTRKVINKYYTDENAFPFSRSFETWETDKIIQVVYQTVMDKHSSKPSCEAV